MNVNLNNSKILLNQSRRSIQKFNNRLFWITSSATCLLFIRIDSTRGQTDKSSCALIFFFGDVSLDDHNLSWLFPNATHFVLENEITTLYIQNLMDDIFSSLLNSIHSTALKDQTLPASKNADEEILQIDLKIFVSLSFLCLNSN